MEEAGTATTSTTHTSSKKARLPGGFGGGSRGDGAVCECVCEVCDQKNTKFFCASCLKYRIEQQRSKINAILERKQKLAVHVVQLTRVKNEQLHEERKRRMYENRIHSLRQRIQQMKEECVQEQVRVAVISSNNLEREKRLKEERKILEMRRSKYDVLRKTDLPRLRKQVEEMEEKLCVTRKKHCNTLVQLLPVYYPYNLSGTTAASSTSTAAAAAASSNKSSVLDSNSSMLSRRSADNHSNHLPPHPHHHVRSNNTLAITTTTTTTSSSHNNNNNNHSIPQPDTVCIISKDLQLPIRSRTFDGVDEDVVAGGLGYIVVVVQLLSWYLRVPLRYPMKYGGSKSTIHEIVIKPKHNNNNNNNSGTGINNNSNSSSSSNGSSKSSTDTSAGPGVNGAGGVATTVSGITDDIVATALGSTVDPRLVTTGSMAEESYVIHQHRYPLFSKGVNHAMYEHGLALLNQNIVQLCLAQGVPILASSCASPVVASCSGPHQPLAAATAIVHATTATNNATTTNATPPQTLRTRSQSFTGSSPSSSAPADGGGGGPLSSGSSNVEILYGSLVGNLASLCSSKTLGSDGPWFQVLRPSPMLSLNYYHNLASSIHNDRHHRTAEAANHSKKQQGSNNNNNNSSSSSSEYNSGGSSDASSHYDTESMMAMINGSRHQHEQEEDDFVIVDAGISSTEVHVHYF